MAELVSDKLWNEVKDLLPKRKVSPRGGRPAVNDRHVLAGIVFVLRSGIPWRLLPIEMGCGSGVTCWRRLRQWTQAGVWSAVQEKLLKRLGREGKLDTSRAIVDSASVRALLGDRTPAPTPPIAGKKGVNVIC
jgi:transposase